MLCPKCGGKTGTLNTLLNPKDNETYRRKECKICGFRFYTFESVAEDTDDFRNIRGRCRQEYLDGLDRRRNKT